jgi:hypothetical protein
MRAIKEYGMRTSQHPVAAYAYFICSASAEYADQFGGFSYEEYDTTIEITGYRYSAMGDVIIPSQIIGKPGLGPRGWT